MKTVMPTYKAVVQAGRIVIDNLDYEDGTEVELEVVNDNDIDDMSDEERERLHAVLERSLAQAEAGQTRPAREVIAELRARGR